MQIDEQLFNALLAFVRSHPIKDSAALGLYVRMAKTMGEQAPKAEKTEEAHDGD
jgi:hypothetical protein